MKLLITGANGQLGRAINEVYKNAENVEVVNTDVADLDITNLSEVMEFTANIKPDAIVNCAAHTAVDKCETDADNAYKINAIGPRNLSLAAQKNGAKMVHISTDYVFDGNGETPYTEFDATNPTGVYGKTKLAGENFVKDFAGKYFIIRTAWLYGDGNNFVKTMLRLSESRDEVSVVADQKGTPTSTAELARMISKLLPTDSYGLYHGTCEGECTWADFAEEIFKQAGKSTKVRRITTEEYPTPARRPAYSVLENKMLSLTSEFRFNDWKTALEEYMCQ